VLRREGHAAIFSEELTTDAGGKSRLDLQERAQAEAADLILVIAGSEGSIAEVHDYARSRRFSSKMHIFIDEKRLAGYSGRGLLESIARLFHNVHQYKYPKDVRECHLLGMVTRKVDDVRASKMYME
jgi:hypothetical protein